MHEQHKIEKELGADAERISAKYSGAPVVIIVGGSKQASVPRCMTGSTFGKGRGRLRDLLGMLETASQIETLKHFGLLGASVRSEPPAARRPTFREVYDCLILHGPAKVLSSRQTEYTVEASAVKGVQAIVARPRTGRVAIHEDCWGDQLTCQGTRAGGIYNGPYSIYDWYAEHCTA